MAFNLNNLYILTIPANDSVLPMYSYTTTDTIATVKASNYFVGINAYVGASILCKASDGVATMLINTLTNNTEGIATAITTVSAQSTPPNPFDVVTASVLTTSLSSFNSASAGTAVSVTLTEYTSLQGLAGAVLGGCTNVALVSANGNAYSDNFTDGAFSGYTTIAIGKKPYAFAMNMGVVSNFQMKVGTVSTLNNIHSNLVACTNSATYFVIKTPSYTTLSSSVVAGYSSIGGFASATGSGSYNYEVNNVLNISANTQTSGEKRYQVIGR